MPDNIREIIGWGLVAGSIICAITAAALHGGAFEAFTAASASLSAAATTWGLIHRTPTTTK
jgi:hypothetical protein